MRSLSSTHPSRNPDARTADDVLGTDLPDTVSKMSWNRPYRYFVVRTDDDRLSRLDDHEEGRIIVSGFFTRHNALAHRVLCERNGPGEYVVGHEPNEGYEG